MSTSELILPASPLPDPEANWPVTKAVRLGSVIAFAVTGFFLVWGGLAPLSSAVVANGELIGAENRQLIQHLEGGVVREIHVRDGHLVTKGDLLVRLDDRAVRSDLVAVEIELADTGFRLARLAAEAAGATNLSLTLPDDLSHAKPERILAARSGQLALFTARQTTNARIAAEMAASIDALKADAEALRARAVAKRAETAIVRTELTRREGLRTRNLGTQDALFATELQLAQTEATVSELVAAASQADAAAVKARAEGDRIRAERQERIRVEMTEIRARRTELEAQRAKLAAALLRTEVHAPATGVITGLTLHTIGGIVAPGQQIGLVVPQGTELVMSAAVPPQDVDRVRVGQDARIRFSAFDQHRTPEIAGTVRNVAADRSTTPDGTSFYAVEIALAGDLPTGLQLLPGMQAEVFIQHGERTFLSYLFKPITDSFAKALNER